MLVSMKLESILLYTMFHRYQMHRAASSSHFIKDDGIHIQNLLLLQNNPIILEN